jgi:hypothetical protein
MTVSLSHSLCWEAAAESLVKDDNVDPAFMAKV